MTSVAVTLGKRIISPSLSALACRGDCEDGWGRERKAVSGLTEGLAQCQWAGC